MGAGRACGAAGAWAEDHAPVAGLRPQCAPARHMTPSSSLPPFYAGSLPSPQHWAWLLLIFRGALFSRKLSPHPLGQGQPPGPVLAKLSPPMGVSAFSWWHPPNRGLLQAVVCLSHCPVQPDTGSIFEHKTAVLCEGQSPSGVGGGRGAALVWRGHLCGGRMLGRQGPRHLRRRERPPWPLTGLRPCSPQRHPLVGVYPGHPHPPGAQ